jgi:hypothetical protein
MGEDMMALRRAPGLHLLDHKIIMSTVKVFYCRLHACSIPLHITTLPAAVCMHMQLLLSSCAGRRVIVVAQATPTKDSARLSADAAAPVKGSSPAAAPADQTNLLPTGAPVDEPIELAWPAKRSWAEVVLTKAVDTVEDIAVIARRTFVKDLPG